MAGTKDARRAVWGALGPGQVELQAAVGHVPCNGAVPLTNAPAHHDDRALWTRAREGDSAAFGELFERHCDLVYNFVFRRTGSWNLAEDTVSTVFLEALPFWTRRIV